jgi:hypothetical protein
MFKSGQALHMPGGNMLSSDIANWIIAITGVLSLIVSIIALVRANEAKRKVNEIIQSAIHRPMISGGGGGGGGGGPGGGTGGAGGGVQYDGSQNVGR